MSSALRNKGASGKASDVFPDASAWSQVQFLIDCYVCSLLLGGQLLIKPSPSTGFLFVFSSPVRVH